MYLCLFLEKVRDVLISYKNEQFRVSAVTSAALSALPVSLLAISLFILAQPEELILLARPHMKYLSAAQLSHCARSLFQVTAGIYFFSLLHLPMIRICPEASVIQKLYLYQC